MFIDHAGNLLFSGGSSSGIGVFSYGASSGAGQAVLMDSSTFEDKQVEFFEINGILYGVAVGKGRIARYSEGAWELESASAGGYSGGTFRMTSFKGYTYYVVRISENDYRIVRSAP